MQAKERYAELADMLALGGASADEKVALLIEAVEALKAKCGVPVSCSSTYTCLPRCEARMASRLHVLGGLRCMHPTSMAYQLDSPSALCEGFRTGLCRPTN